MYEPIESEELHFLKVLRQVLINKGFITNEDIKNAEHQLYEQRVQLRKEVEQMINDFIKEYGDE